MRSGIANPYNEKLGFTYETDELCTIRRAAFRGGALTTTAPDASILSAPTFYGRKFVHL